MFTHFHGKSKQTMGPLNEPQKCRLSIRIVPQMNEDYSILQISKEQFKKVRYAVVFREHFHCCKNTSTYYFTEFYDDNYIPFFLLSLKRFRNELQMDLSEFDLRKKYYFPFNEFNYQDESNNFSIKISLIENKQCEIVVKGNSWYQRDNKGIKKVKKELIFYMNGIELLTDLSRFCKNNEYISEPFTFRTDLKYEPDKLRVYYKKEKPLLIVNLNECFSIREREGYGTEPLYWHLHWRKLGEYQRFNELLSSIFNPIYVCHKKFHSYLFEWFGIDCDKIVPRDEFSNEKYAHVFYLGTSISEKYNEIFNQFYFITVLLETRNIEKQIESLANVKKEVFLNDMSIVNATNLLAYSKGQNTFEINKDEKSNFEKLKNQYINKGYELIGNPIVDVNIAFLRYGKRKVMIGAFEEERLYDHWRIAGKKFYDFFRKIPSKIECTDYLWDYDAIEEIHDGEEEEDCNPFTFKGDYYRSYALFDALDKEFFKYRSDIYNDDKEHIKLNDAWSYIPELSGECYHFGKKEVPVIINPLLPKYCFVMEV